MKYFCLLCDEPVYSYNEDYFIMEYRERGTDPRGVVMHPECFKSIAGKKLAAECGYKIEKATEPSPERIDAGPIEPPNTTFSPNANVGFEYQDVSFKLANCRVYCYNEDGERFFTVEEIKKK